MIKNLCLILALIALVRTAPVEETFKELPCLNKVAGQRLPHPKNPHQFLRCVTADTVWIETCPDNLFYNPHSEICDWDQVDKSTTTTLAPDVVKTRPVLVKFRPLSSAAMGRMETTVIDDISTLDGEKTPIPDFLTTTVSSRVETTTESTVQTITVAPSTTTTTRRAEFIAPVEQLPVVETTTPKFEFIAPLEHIPTTTPILDVVVSSTVRVEPVIVVETTTVAPVLTTAVPVDTIQIVEKVPIVQQVPVVQQVQVVEKVPIVQTVPISVGQQIQVTTPVVPVQITTTLPVIEMSTSAF